MSEKLLPCPFCGRAAETVGHYGIAPYHVRCKIALPLCTAAGPAAASKEEAETLWNTRTSHPKPIDPSK